MRAVLARFVSCSAIALASTLAAQTGPGIVNPATTDTVLAPANFTTLGIYRSGALSTRLRQVAGLRAVGNAATAYTLAMTVNSVDAKYGNTSLNDSGYVIMGELDELKGQFTPNTLAAQLNNASGGNFGLMLFGRFAEHAVLDWADGVYYARRASHLVPFGVPAKVQGLAGTYVDPALGQIAGKLHLFYVEPYVLNGQNRSRIVAQEIDVSNPAQPALVANTAKTVADFTLNTTGDILVHSPTPILDSLGNTHGMWMAERLGNDSNMYFKDDLDPKSPQQMVVDGTVWLNNGSIVGGRLYYAGGGLISRVDVAWLCGDVIDIGTTGRLLTAYWDRDQAPNVVALFLSAGTIPPVSIPGIAGKLALDPATLASLGAVPAAAFAQEVPVPVPNDPSLKGAQAWIQAVAVDALSTGNSLTFTNTSRLRVR